MGMNMLSASNVDDISIIWDTRSNECQSIHDGDLNAQTTAGNHTTTSNNGCHPRCKCSKCGVSGEALSAHFEHCSAPSICDVDVRLVNRYMQQQLKKME